MAPANLPYDFRAPFSMISLRFDRISRRFVGHDSRRAKSIGAALVGGWIAIAPAPAIGLASNSGPEYVAPPAAASDISTRPLVALDTGAHTGWVTRLLASPYNNELISISHDKTVRFWDIATGETTRVLRPPVGPGMQGRLHAAAISADGRLLAIGGESALLAPNDHRVLLIALPEGQIARTLRGHNGPIRDLAFSPDGSRLASASDDRTARVWDPATGELLQTLAGHQDRVSSVAWSPDGGSLISGSWDRTARVWNLAERSRAVAAGKSPNPLSRIAISPIMAAPVTIEHGEKVMSVAWLSSGRGLITGGGQAIRWWSPAGASLHAWDDLPERIQRFTVSADASRLVYAWGSMNHDDHGSAVLSLANRREISRFLDHRNTPMDGIFLPDGQAVASCASSTEICIWRCDSGQPIQRIEGPGDVVRAVGWSPDGHRIAWGQATSPGAAIHATLPLEHTFDLATLGVGPPPEGSYQRAISQSGGLRIERTSNQVAMVFRGGQPLATLRLEQAADRLRAKTLLPGGRAALASSNGVMIHDIASGQPLGRLAGHADTVWALAPSPDGRFLLTGGGDQTMEIWNLATGRRLLSLFIGGKQWIAWTPEGYFAASPGGESLMGWLVNRGAEHMADFYPSSEFHESLYRPDVIARLLETGDVATSLAAADRAHREQSAPIILDTRPTSRPEAADTKRAKP